MLSFVGLGLHDERSVTIRGRETIGRADRVLAEFYTSTLPGTNLAALTQFHEVNIEELTRDTVEGDPSDILDAAHSAHVAFVTAGDPMISTTHVDLRLRAADRGIETEVIHAPSAETAASGLSGLQNYRFGKATTVPFPRGDASGVPDSVLDTIHDNTDRGLHTLVYLDIQATEERYMTGSTAAGLLADTFPDRLAVVIARAGSADPLVRADRLDQFAETSFGPPLHLLVVPGDLHPIEADALETFAGAPPALLNTE